MAKKETSSEPKKRKQPKAPAQTKRRVTKPGGFYIEGLGQVDQGAEVTNKVKKFWEAWQRKCGGNVKIEDYTH